MKKSTRVVGYPLYGIPLDVLFLEQESETKMTILLVGLFIFFTIHLTTLAPMMRTRMISTLGKGPYMGLYSLISAIGLGLFVWGYSQAPYVTVWTPPAGFRHLALALMPFAIILMVVAYVPAGRIKPAVRHPMLASIKIWAFAHLLANGDLASMLLFGSFLAFAVVDRIAVARRERAGLLRLPARGPVRNDVLATLIGLALYIGIVLWLHSLVIGVPALP